jgi:chromosomal replication initiator protein
MTIKNAAEAGDRLSLFHETLRRNFGEPTFKAWFSDLQIDEAGDEAVILSTESDLRRDRIDQQFKLELMQLWCDNIYKIKRLLIVKRPALMKSAARIAALAPAPDAARAKRLAVINSDFQSVAPEQDEGVEKPASKEASAPRIEEIATRLDPRTTFESFAVDGTNEVAVHAVRQIFDESAPRDVIYIYGVPGVGKSHLLQAAGNAWLQRYPKGRCLYLTHNNVQKGCVAALLSANATRATMKLQRDMLENDLILFDDVHLLGGKVKTMGELVNLITALRSAGRQVIIAGEHAPANLLKQGVTSRLADRLAEGLSVGIERGGEALRRAVLHKNRDGADLRCTITDEALDLIARLFSSSMRECIGAYKHLSLVYRDKSVTVGPAEALAALKTRLGDRKRTGTLDETLAAAASAFGITLEEIKGKAQPQRIVRARHAFVYVARTSLCESYPRIGRTLGRDHTTAMSSMERAEALIVRDKAFAEGVQRIRIEIGADLPAEKLLAAKG